MVPQSGPQKKTTQRPQLTSALFISVRDCYSLTIMQTANHVIAKKRSPLLGVKKMVYGIRNSLDMIAFPNLSFNPNMIVAY